MLNFWIALLVLLGTWFILADLMRVPSYAVSRATHNLGKRQNKKVSRIELWMRDLAAWLAGKIRIGEYRRAQLEMDLRTADMNISPETYRANAIVHALIIGVFAIPFCFILPILALLVVVCSITMYIYENGKVKVRIRDKRSSIERELPRFVANIEKTLMHNRDVLYILDTYKETAGEELKRELTITVADMRSGNYEVALTRLESRVGSAMMSDVVRGLISVIRGNDTAVYWGSLSLKLEDFQRQLLKQETNKAPKRVKRLSMALLVCFMMTYVVVIGQVLISSLGTMFG